MSTHLQVSLHPDTCSPFFNFSDLWWSETFYILGWFPFVLEMEGGSFVRGINNIHNSLNDSSLLLSKEDNIVCNQSHGQTLSNCKNPLFNPTDYNYQWTKSCLLRVFMQVKVVKEKRPNNRETTFTEVQFVITSAAFSLFIPNDYYMWTKWLLLRVYMHNAGRTTSEPLISLQNRREIEWLD